MGTVLINALLKLAESHPEILEQIAQAGLQLLAKELAKKAAA